MMGEKISVIVPVYNVEAYLERCVESILQQTYTHFELILINDGSTDSSGQICDHLASQYENIKVYHIENAGVSNARNMGIQLATGSWVTFIDSDDFVTQDYLATLASAVEGVNVGFVIAPLHHIKNGIVTDLPSHSGKTELWSTEETMKELLMTTRTSFFPVAKLFKRDLLADEKFNTNYHLAEDALFLTELLLKTRCSCVFIDKPVYYYDHREGSATTSVNRHVFDTIEVYKQIIAQVSQAFPNLKYELINRECWSYITVYDKIIFTSREEYQKEKAELRTWIVQHRREIWKDAYFTTFRKVAILSLVISPWLYKKIVGLKN
ncbi:glycosyltransferase family 2 protein [Streptococcus oralis]|jgi:exopolysaccharide biosynthesis protein, sugar transferase|uniref:Glycosyltransferase family 2 protein n=2 Tax=Streptococcus oralis TaxID=1303 RepID=A0AAW7W7K5_STROR|nr:glycosyltransferase family 2 protein [Streptococcus oralis]ATF56466.1 capsular biosynthesis protein CpsI [Streptococcus oralis]MBT3115161.1 glycosyltransferase [Streptococcus oralis]MCY7107733.1 glycosyltransferase [Streptococcus oralis]MDO6343413.1 glycosyltransferase family 2 protein [Streptococcus oralis]MDO6347391.1 glycosyltransferase family 2 protein [Streptococcus oralis]